MTPRLSPRDRRELRRRGLAPAALYRQTRLLRRPPAFLKVLRPCTIKDGIERLSPAARRRLARQGELARRTGRVSFFVPASGAASRLVEPLNRLDRARRESGLSARALLESKGTPFKDARRLFASLPSLALARPLEAVLARWGLRLGTLLRSKEFDVVLDAMLGDRGLRLGRLPKGILPFHKYGRGHRTAVEEHLAEAAGWAPKSGRVDVHFTVSPEHLRAFRSLARGDKRCAPRFTSQAPSTDTVALDGRGRWVRRADGGLLFRPGGHGALLGNLERTRGDLVLIRNIDNVPIRAVQRQGVAWRLALIGRLVELQDKAAGLLAGLEGRSPSEKALREAEGFLKGVLGIGISRNLPPGTRADRIALFLQRPWRVCGMVRNTGEPGGGPYWVRERGDVSRQIVEASQLTGVKRRALRKPTHFNPVDMAVGLRDARGRAYALPRFADASSVLVGRKIHEGEEIRTLEHPGLWNGGMAFWNTVFVELPSRLFHPVKTITDLLRPGHGKIVLKSSLP